VKLDDAERRRWRAIEHILLAAFAIFLLYFLTGFRFEALVTGDTRQADFRMWYLLPPQIAAHDYPSVVSGNWLISFPYLPSAVAMLLPLNLLPQVAAFIVWMLLQGIAFAVVIGTSLRLAGLARSHRRLPIAAAAVFIVSAPIEWDLRAHNNNLIYLALVMLGLVARRTWIAAILFAVTANLKLYSAVLIPGFVWRREYRLALATTVAAPGLAVGLSLLVFGPEQSFKLGLSWIDELRYTMHPIGTAQPPLSLQKTAGALLDVAPLSDAAWIAARCVQMLWLAMALGYFLATWRRSADGETGIARLSDVVVILMLPLPFSSWLVPYHAVVMLPAFVLIVAALVDSQRPKGLRIAVGIACAGCIALRFAVPAWDLRAGVLTLSLMLTLLALGAIRLTTAPPTDELRPV
jgi:Glycosyltransferase family 87